MIKHIVMWTLKDQAEGADKSGNLGKMKNLLEQLPQAIPDILQFEVGAPQAPAGPMADVVLVSAFASWEGLARYQAHPQHQAVARFIQAVTAQRVVADYETV
jgi:hypothetical protein